MYLQKARQKTHFKSQKTKYKQMVKHTNITFSANKLTYLQKKKDKRKQKHQILANHLWGLNSHFGCFGIHMRSLKNMCNL